MSNNIYRESVRYLRMNGWQQHGYFEYAMGSRACIAGALFASSRAKEDMYDRATQTLSEMLGLPAVTYAYEYTCGLAGWNDAPGRTLEDVLRLLEHAAEKLDAERGTACH